MRSQSRTRLSLSLAALVLSAASCGEEEDVSPSFEDRIPVGTEVQASERLVTWGDEVELSGNVRQGDVRLEGEEVALEADPYPFDGSFAEIDSSTTGPQGEFSFAAGPAANTDYRVATGEGSVSTSDAVRVLVEPRIELIAEPTAGGTRFTTEFRHPEERSIQGSTVLSYAAAVPDASGRLPFVRAVEVDQDRPGRSSASITLPFAEGEVVYETCESYTGDSGMSGSRRTCPQTSIPAP
jgi:hypothetical protein